MRSSKPAFHSVIDLGLRDVDVKNEPRRLATHFGKAVVPVFALAVVLGIGTCAVVSEAGAGAGVVAVLAMAWLAAAIGLAVRTAGRAPVAVVKVAAEGPNQATWLMIAHFVLLAFLAGVAADPMLVPIALITLAVSLFLWRDRRRVPEALQELRPHLAADEPVLGDGIGTARGARDRRNALRLVAATDRRVLVAGPAGKPGGLPLVDVPYRAVSRFGVDWKLWGHLGVLSLSVEGEEHTITGVAPANLLSIALALQSHGVPADDPEAVAEAERGWEEAQQRGKSRTPLLDREAMSTPAFDRGLWLLLALFVVAFYVNPYTARLGASWEVLVTVPLVVAAMCVVCGYVSGTRSSLAYIAPLNLLIVPVFLFVEASGVILTMILVSAVAAIGLSAGSALRRANPARSGERPAPGSLRYAVSGLALTRISAVLLAAMATVAVATAAAGFDLSRLRLAVEEARATQLPVDGRSNLTGSAASFTYTPVPDLKELVTDQHFDAGPNDGARWELRSSFSDGYNVVSLANYIFEPRLDDPAAIADFVAGKDREHSRAAGSDVTHTERVVDGRRGYVWNHGSDRGRWYYAAWFPHPVHSVRVECVAEEREDEFKRLCAEAMRSLDFH